MAEESLSCASCGRLSAPGAEYCSGCGSTLSQAPGIPTQTLVASGEFLTNCPGCGGRMQPGDQYCSGCGQVRPISGSGSLSSIWEEVLARLTRATKGEFEIVGEIGRGAMGAVYLARDIALNRKVAIKVIAPQLLSDQNMVERFRLEARTVASLRHPHIVTIYAVRSFDDLHYFVMDFVEGCSLRKVVKTHGPLPIPVIQALLFQVGSALAHAHRRGGGVIHRDVKPANIMIDGEGDAFLTDFGISKVAESSGLTLTGTGLIIGTPEYMSPEQCKGEPLTGAGDQYSLGIVAYEMLCGHAPFTGTQYSVLLAHGSEDPKPIEELRQDCPPPVAEAVTRMLARDPADRWPNLDAAVVGMGGAPLGHADPVRASIVELIPRDVEGKAGLDTDSTLSSVPRASTSESEAPTAVDVPTAVYVARLPEWLEPGESFDLRARAEGAEGAELADAEIGWSSSDPSVAIVESGRVIALSPGVVSIIATAGSVEASVTLGVSEPSPADIVVEPGTIEIETGETVPLSAVVRDRRGTAIQSDLVWSCSDEEVARVSKIGEVSGHAAGTAIVTAAAGDVRATARVAVWATLEEEAIEPPPPSPASGDQKTVPREPAVAIGPERARKAARAPRGKARKAGDTPRESARKPALGSDRRLGPRLFSL